MPPSKQISILRLIAAMAFAILVLCPNRAMALDPGRTLTQYLQRIWQTPQGLPDATIYDICQSRDGYLYLATQSGLARFDGVRFTIVPLRSAAGDKIWVRRLVEDNEGNLWIATQNSGLFCLSNGSIRHYDAADGLGSDSVRTLFLDNSGTLWISTTKGVFRHNGQSFVPLPDSSQTLADALRSIQAIGQSHDGTIWLGSAAGQLLTWNGSAIGQRKLASEPPSSIQTILGLGDGTLWIGTDRGLVRLDTAGAANERLFTSADGLANNWVMCLSQSADGSLWIGTKAGFTRYRHPAPASQPVPNQQAGDEIGDEIESFRSSDGLSQSDVYALCEDREGSLWVGTRHGLNQFVDRRTIPFTTSEGLASNNTGPLIENKSGEIFVGTLDAGLSLFDGRRFSNLTTANGLASNHITCLASSDAGLWIGTDAGLNRLQDGRVRQALTAADGLPKGAIQCLFADRDGALWIGCAQGLALLKNGRIDTPPPPPGLTNLDVLSIGQRADGAVLVAFRGGAVAAYVNGTPQTPMILQQDVDSFYLDKQGQIWMGTLGGGLRLMQGTKLISFGVEDGLFDDDIYGVVCDAQDNLWMACSKGVFSVNRGDLLRFAEGAITKLHSTPFSPTDALRTIECKSGVQPAAYRMNDGRIWFSTIRGVIVIDPSRLPLRLPAAPAAIEAIIVDGRQQQAAQIAQLPPGTKNIEFHYTGLSFLFPTRMTFRYMLEGFDKEWVDAGMRREAIYTNLPPGHYRFLVAARNIDGTWTGQTAATTFTIEPYFYQRAWFWPSFAALAALLLAGGIGLIYRLRVRRIRQRMDLILDERTRIARELHDTLLQGFSGVTMEMQALFGKLPVSDNRQTLAEIIRDAGTCMQEARLSVAGLRAGTARQKKVRPGETGRESARGTEQNMPQEGHMLGLSGAIAQMARQITETKDIRLRLDLPQDGDEPLRLPPDSQYNLVRIAQEAITNSVKHSGARSIDVKLRCDAHAVTLTVRDDGGGFEVGSPNATRPGHYGLVGMRERASQIGAELRIESSPNEGTILHAVLPIPQIVATAAAAE